MRSEIDTARRLGPWARFASTHLHDYNAAATRYWLSLVVLGGVALVWAAMSVSAMAPSEFYQALGWLGVVVVAAAFPLHIPRSKHSIAAGDVVIFLMLALHGVGAAVMAAALEGLVASSRTSTRLSSRLVSCTAIALAMVASGALYNAGLALSAIAGVSGAAAQLAALAAAALLQAAASTSALMLVLSLKRGQRLSFADWSGNASWVGTLQLLSALLAGILSLNAQIFGRSSVVVGATVIGLSLVLLRAHFKRQMAEQQVQESRVAAAELDAEHNLQRFHCAFSQASIGMAIVATDGRVLQANQALHALLGFAPGDLPGRPFASLLHAGDVAELEQHIIDVLARRQTGSSIELRCMGADRRETWVSLHCALFAAPGASDSGLIFQLHDITSHRRAEELRHLAYHDTLTDLANRKCFQERLAAAVERNRLDRRTRFAVMVLDLDRFKVVNDSLGHSAGDALIQEVARRLRNCVRPTDLVARLGGDEFAVLLEEINSADDAVRLGERLLASLGQSARINGIEIRPLASIGMTFSETASRDPDEVLRDADLAMYQAKSRGKGRLALFDASLHEQLGHELQLESDLRDAIAEGHLSLAFQPLYQLAPHRLIGFEALARWKHPTRGAISPEIFIPLAEEMGCIEALTAWAIETAVCQLAEWRAMTSQDQFDGSQRELVMHVNVSGKDIAQTQFVPHIREVLQRHRVPPRLLVLEITESSLMDHRDMALRALSELCTLGVKVAIDDFGTGYSSLAHLSTLPFDCLKIDRSFVMGIDKSRQNLEIVRAVISLGRSLNKQVMAEGIETTEQLHKLRELGATIGQGYLLARPLAPAQVRQLLLPCEDATRPDGRRAADLQHAP